MTRESSIIPWFHRFSRITFRWFGLIDLRSKIRWRSLPDIIVNYGRSQRKMFTAWSGELVGGIECGFGFESEWVEGENCGCRRFPSTGSEAGSERWALHAGIHCGHPAASGKRRWWENGSPGEEKHVTMTQISIVVTKRISKLRKLTPCGGNPSVKDRRFPSQRASNTKSVWEPCYRVIIHIDILWYKDIPSALTMEIPHPDTKSLIYIWPVKIFTRSVVVCFVESNSLRIQVLHLPKFLGVKLTRDLFHEQYLYRNFAPIQVVVMWLLSNFVHGTTAVFS